MFERLTHLLIFVFVVFLSLELLQIPIGPLEIRIHQIVLVLLGLWFIGRGIFLLRNHHQRWNISFRYLPHTFVLLIVGMSLIVGISGVLRTALIPTVIQTTVFITMGVVFAIIAYAMKTPGMMRTIFKALIVGTILNILFALYQAVAFKFGLLDFMVFEGRVNGFLPEPNWFAIWHSLIVAIWMPLTFFSPHWFSKRWNWMWWGFLYFNLVVILLSLTRASWLALCIMGILFYISLIWPARYSLRKVGSHIGKMTLIFVLAVVSIESLALSPFSLYERAESIITQTTTHYTSKDDKSLNKKEAKEKQKKEGDEAVQKKVVRDVNVVSRLQDYQRSLEISAQYPIGGVGIAGYKERVGETRNTSNIFLGALVAGGILGFSIYISMYYILIREVIRLIRQKYYLLATIIGNLIVVIGITGMFNNGLLLAFIWLFFGICVGLAAFGKDLHVSSEREE